MNFTHVAEHAIAMLAPGLAHEADEYQAARLYLEDALIAAYADGVAVGAGTRTPPLPAHLAAIEARAREYARCGTTNAEADDFIGNDVPVLLEELHRLRTCGAKAQSLLATYEIDYEPVDSAQWIGISGTDVGPPE